MICFIKQNRNWIIQFVLFNKTMLEAPKLFIDSRKLCEINSDNTFMFAVHYKSFIREETVPQN